MKNFKEIAEKCLSGELSGTFVTAFGNNWHSNYLQRHTILGHEMPGQYVLGPGIIYNEIGQCEGRERLRIIDFISDNMQEQIKIDIPEGKVPVMEQTEKGVFITWKEKELTYREIYESLYKNGKIIHCIKKNPEENTVESLFIKKVNVLRKLTNIRNYFGKPDKHIGWCIIYKIADNCIVVTEEHNKNPYKVVFKEKEHAEQAIKMLGDELKYLSEPW